RGVQPHIFLIAGLPIENSVWHLAKRRPGEHTQEEKCEEEREFGVSHSNSIETPRPYARKVSVRKCLLEVSCPEGQSSPACFLMSGQAKLRRVGSLPTLPPHADQRSIRFVTFILN